MRASSSIAFRSSLSRVRCLQLESSCASRFARLGPKLPPLVVQANRSGQVFPIVLCRTTSTVDTTSQQDA